MSSYAETALARSLSFLADSQAAIANNIANATTHGFKRKTPHAAQIETRFQSMLDQALPTIAYTESTDLTRGSQRASADRMTAALGDGQFFAVRDPNGTFYTRRGEFVLDAEGFLVTPNGEQYLGADGQPIQVGLASELRIASNGLINALVEGEDREVGQLGVFRSTEPDSLQSIGRSLFIDRSGGDATGVHPSPSVSQGYVEESNVDVLRELVQMIGVQRGFEATTRALSAVGSLQQSYVQMVNR